MKSTLSKLYPTLRVYNMAAASTKLTLPLALSTRPTFSSAQRFLSASSHFWGGARITSTVQLRSWESGAKAAFLVARSEVRGCWGSSISRKMSNLSVTGSHSAGVAATSVEEESSDFIDSPVVTVDWLHRHLKDSHVKVLDASWYMPADARNPYKEYQECHIPDALFFDVDGVVDPTTDLPHMLPTEPAFAAAASALGLSNDDSIILYDGKGLFSAARVWWMFRVFGHEKVWVLDGGLPKWKASTYPVSNTVAEDVLERVNAAASAVKTVYSQTKTEPSSFKASFQESLVWSLDQVHSNIGDKQYRVVDARSKARFDGIAPEPRKGVRGGHIPGSTCVPFPEVLSSEGSLLRAEELKEKFVKAGVDVTSPIVASCGTGVTACILALALHRLGKKEVPIYDGSWTEWGLADHTRVETI